MPASKDLLAKISKVKIPRQAVAKSPVEKAFVLVLLKHYDVLNVSIKSHERKVLDNFQTKIRRFDIDLDEFAEFTATRLKQQTQYSGFYRPPAGWFCSDKSVKEYIIHRNKYVSVKMKHADMNLAMELETVQLFLFLSEDGNCNSVKDAEKLYDRLFRSDFHKSGNWSSWRHIGPIKQIIDYVLWSRGVFNAECFTYVRMWELLNDRCNSNRHV